MKMTIGAELPDGFEAGHEELSATVGSLIAHALLPMFAETMTDEMARANVEGIVTELAYLFDDGEIVLGGKTFHPRLAFVDENGATLPGAGAMRNLHEMVEAPFDIDPAAQISFEAPDFDE